MTNISDHLNEPIDISMLRQSLMDKTGNLFGGLENYRLSEKAWVEIDRLAEDKYRSWAWNYGNTPAFTIRHRIKAPSHSLSIILHVKRGYVRTLEIEEGSFGNAAIAFWQKKLIGKPYDGINLEINDHP